MTTMVITTRAISPGRMMSEVRYGQVPTLPPGRSCRGDARLDTIVVVLAIVTAAAMKTHWTYILDGHTPVPCDDMARLSAFYRDGDRRVALTILDSGITVSTVFLVHNHQWGSGPPLLFETMVFGTDDDMTERYSTWDEAQVGHDAIVAE